VSLDPMALAGGITAAVAALTGVGVVLRWLHKRWRTVEHFLEDWRGEPARPGVPARLGVPERLSMIEAELRPNHGGSLRDAIDRTEQRVMAVETQVGDHLAEHARTDAYRLQVTQDRTTLEHGPRIT